MNLLVSVGLIQSKCITFDYQIQLHFRVFLVLRERDIINILLKGEFSQKSQRIFSTESSIKRNRESGRKISIENLSYRFSIVCPCENLSCISDNSRSGSLDKAKITILVVCSTNMTTLNKFQIIWAH